MDIEEEIEEVEEGEDDNEKKNRKGVSRKRIEKLSSENQWTRNRKENKNVKGKTRRNEN